MKKILPIINLMILLTSCLASYAQLPDGSTATNFTFKDMNGKTQNLYSYLDSGKAVVIDISASWCGPCWRYHNSGELEQFYKQYGPEGTNEAMVLFVEGDQGTNDQCLTNSAGCSKSTVGNWVLNTPYPIMNPPSPQINEFDRNYQVAYFPLMYLICPDKKTKKVDKYNSQMLHDAIQSACNK